MGTDGRNCRVWINPANPAVVVWIALESGSGGLRCLANEKDLYIWRSSHLLHGRCEQLTGLSGVRLVLSANGSVQANLETVALPEFFPWVFGVVPSGDMDASERQGKVEDWLRAHPRLQTILPQGFQLGWYM